MIGQRIVGNILGHKPKADSKSRNNEDWVGEELKDQMRRLWLRNECPGCGSHNIQKVGGFRECRECGFNNYGEDA